MEERMYRYTEYEEGSAVRKLVPERETRRERRPGVVQETQEHRQEKTWMAADIVSMFLLAATICATVYLCISYLMVQSDISQLDKSISALEKKITNVAKENDAVQAVLDNEITDLDYIYQMAVGVLGMVYPNNNEVVYYEQEDTGYFRQYHDIPEK